MADRPPLRIGQYGRIKRIYLGRGVWLARCRFRDSDGVTRIVERRGPARDKRGALAEQALVEALQGRRAPGAGGRSLLTPGSPTLCSSILRAWPMTTGPRRL